MVAGGDGLRGLLGEVAAPPAQHQQLLELPVQQHTAVPVVRFALGHHPPHQCRHRLPVALHHVEHLGPVQKGLASRQPRQRLRRHVLPAEIHRHPPAHPLGVLAVMKDPGRYQGKIPLPQVIQPVVDQKAANPLLQVKQLKILVAVVAAHLAARLPHCPVRVHPGDGAKILTCIFVHSYEILHSVEISVILRRESW